MNNNKHINTSTQIYPKKKNPSNNTKAQKKTHENAAAVLCARISSSILGIPFCPPRNTLKMKASDSGAKKKTFRDTNAKKKISDARTLSSAFILLTAKKQKKNGRRQYNHVLINENTER